MSRIKDGEMMDDRELEIHRQYLKHVKKDTERGIIETEHDKDVAFGAFMAGVKTEEETPKKEGKNDEADKEWAKKKQVELDEKRRLKRIEICPEALLSVLAVGKFRVTKSKVPKDVNISNYYLDRNKQTIVITMHHKSFPIVCGGMEIPFVHPTKIEKLK